MNETKESSLRYVMYIRKSSESEDKQALSIKGQEDALQELSRKHNLNVIAIFKEAKSAHIPNNRQEFRAMLDLLYKGKADAIITWHLNRLARNPLDGGEIMWQLSQGGIKAIKTPESSYTGTPDERLMMSIIFGMATKKSDDLGRDVKRGNKNALEVGKWPQEAKIGYLHDRETKELIPDPDRFDKVQELLKLALVGTPTKDIMRVAREDFKLRTRKRKSFGNKLVSQSQVYRILHDIFYTGMMQWNGELYQGNHEPMITMEEYHIIQSRFQEPKQLNSNLGLVSKELTYLGLFECGTCSCRVTGERKSKPSGLKYIYYHCCRKKRNYIFCEEKAVQEHVLDEAVYRFLDSIQLPKSVEQHILKEVKQLQETQAESIVSDIQALKKIKASNEKRIESIRTLLTDKVISKADYVKDKEKYMLENADIDKKIHGLLDKSGGLLEPVKETISFLNKAKFQFVNGDVQKKRLILKTLCSNLSLKAKTPLIQAKFPVQILVENQKIPKVLDRWDEFHTFVKEIKRLKEYLSRN